MYALHATARAHSLHNTAQRCIAALCCRNATRIAYTDRHSSVFTVAAARWQKVSTAGKKVCEKNRRLLNFSNRMPRNFPSKNELYGEHRESNPGLSHPKHIQQYTLPFQITFIFHISQRERERMQKLVWRENNQIC